MVSLGGMSASLCPASGVVMWWCGDVDGQEKAKTLEERNVGPMGWGGWGVGISSGTHATFSPSYAAICTGSLQGGRGCC